MIEIQSLDELKDYLMSNRNSKFDIRFLKDESLNLYFSIKINKYKNSCGCNTGALFMSSSILLCIILKLTIFNFSTFTWFTQTLYALLFVFSSSLFGKFFGILIARIKLKLILSEIESI